MPRAVPQQRAGIEGFSFWSKAMNAKRRVEGFKAVVRSYKEGHSYLEEMDGSHQMWRELSPQGKLGYIARDAAMYDVPFERFAEEVREVFRELPPEAVAEAALRMVLHHTQELHRLDKLLPDDSGTWPTPLIDRFQDMLDRASEAGARARTPRRSPRGQRR